MAWLILCIMFIAKQQQPRSFGNPWIENTKLKMPEPRNMWLQGSWILKWLTQKLL